MLTTKPVTWLLPEYKEIAVMMDTGFPEYERIPVWLLRVASWRRDVDLTAYYAGLWEIFLRTGTCFYCNE